LPLHTDIQQQKTTLKKKKRARKVLLWQMPISLTALSLAASYLLQYLFIYCSKSIIAGSKIFNWALPVANT